MSGSEWLNIGVLILSVAGYGLVMWWALRRENRRGYDDGYQCGRDEACEHVRDAVDCVRRSKARETAAYAGRYKVDERLHNLRAERRLLRQKALGEGEDV